MFHAMIRIDTSQESENILRDTMKNRVPLFYDITLIIFNFFLFVRNEINS